MKKPKIRKAWGIVLRSGKLGLYVYPIKSDAQYALDYRVDVETEDETGAKLLAQLLKEHDPEVELRPTLHFPDTYAELWRKLPVRAFGGRDGDTTRPHPAGPSPGPHSDSRGPACGHSTLL